MLKQRVITAIVLLLFLLPALFYPSPWPFCVVALVLICAAAWEWARLNGVHGAGALAVVAACLGLSILAWRMNLLAKPFPFESLWMFTGVVWVACGAWLLKAGAARWGRISSIVRIAAGVALLVVAWIAVCQARVIGVNFLLSILALAWVADISAYFVGRKLGGRFAAQKLAPSISPGKSWEGVWGGMVGVLILALFWNWIDSALALSAKSIYSHLLERGAWFLVVTVLFLAAMSVVGDLVESLVKRSAGVKDSSALLPGHGGVLDRLDALLPTLPLAMMFYTLR